jgi:AcrR family transcriptional regulator
LVRIPTVASADRRRRERERRRAEVIDAAERLFYARGFDNVTMDMIADAVELSKGSLYLLFKSKDSLFFAIVARKHAAALELLTVRLEAAGTGREKLGAIVRWYIDVARENPEYNEMAATFGPLLWSRMEGADDALLAENAVRFNALIHDACRRGIEDGTVRDDLDPVMLGFYITMIGMSVVSPLPAWKKAFALAGITFDQVLDDFSRFIDPALDASRKGRE